MTIESKVFEKWWYKVFHQKKILDTYTASKSAFYLGIKSAQQDVQRTAIAAGGLGLLAGIVIGYILGAR